jgi:hypothetical protein
MAYGTVGTIENEIVGDTGSTYSEVSFLRHNAPLASVSVEVYQNRPLFQRGIVEVRSNLSIEVNSPDCQTTSSRDLSRSFQPASSTARTKRQSQSRRQ